MVGYDGRQYKGLQFQVNVDEGTLLPTVEAELELALYRAGAIARADFGRPGNVGWTHAGRTDAGVSAACNIIAARLRVGSATLVEFVRRLNGLLPPEVRVHGATRVDDGFDARGQGSRRDYVYLLPSYCVAPALGAVATAAARGTPAADLEAGGAARSLEDTLGLAKVRARADEVSLFREALACFQGSHYFANFCASSRRKRMPGGGADCTEPEAWRVVYECACGEPFLDAAGREWLEVRIGAESFLTHQVRKMLGTAVSVAQGLASVELIRLALDRPMIWTARGLPPQGLLFQRPWFGRSAQGAELNAALADERVSGSISAWLLALRESVAAQDREECQWLRWLATAAAEAPESRRRVAEALQARVVELKEEEDRVGKLRGRLAGLRRAAAGLERELLG